MLKFCYKDLYFHIAFYILVRGFFHLKKQLLKSIKKKKKTDVLSDIPLSNLYMLKEP